LARIYRPRCALFSQPAEPRTRRSGSTTACGSGRGASGRRRSATPCAASECGSAPSRRPTPPRAPTTPPPRGAKAKLNFPSSASSSSPSTKNDDAPASVPAGNDGGAPAAVLGVLFRTRNLPEGEAALAAPPLPDDSASWSASDPEVVDPLYDFSGELMSSYYTFTGGEYEPLESLFTEEYGLMGLWSFGEGGSLNF
jgi:hypothetical protein